LIELPRCATSSCENVGTKSVILPSGKQCFCHNCYVLMKISTVVDQSLMKEISHPNYFALSSYMKISNIIEGQLIQNADSLFSKGGPKSFQEYDDILDLLDAYTYMLYKCSDQAFTKGFSYNAVIYAMKAIANRIPYRYTIDPNDGALGGIFGKHQEIPRPDKLIAMVSIKPIIEPSRIFQKDRKLVADMIMYSVDLLWFIECYSLLARSLMQLGGRGRHVKFMLLKGDEAEFENNVRRLVFNAFSYINNVLQLLTVCYNRAEQLQVKDVKRLNELRMAYGPIKFDLGYFYYTYGLHGDAMRYLTEALDIYQGRNDMIPKPPNAEIGIADCYLYMGGCEAGSGNMEKAREHLFTALEISSKAGITDNIDKVNNIFIESIVKPTLNEKIIRGLKIQSARLKRSVQWTVDKAKKLYEKYDRAQREKDHEASATYAKEIAKLKEIDRVIIRSQYSLEKAYTRLEAMNGVGDMMGVLGPAAKIMQQVQGELKGLVPEVAADLGKVDEMLDTLLTGAGTLTGETIDISACDEEARKVHMEACKIASQRIKALYPELPDDLKKPNDGGHA